MSTSHKLTDRQIRFIDQLTRFVQESDLEETRELIECLASFIHIGEGCPVLISVHQEEKTENYTAGIPEGAIIIPPKIIAEDD